MKKLFLIGALFCSSVSATASNIIVTTGCGRQFVTSGPDGYPGNYNDWLDFVQDVANYYCGGETTFFYREYAPTEPDPIIEP